MSRGRTSIGSRPRSTTASATAPPVQNRQQRPTFREHLAGRIAWHKLINPARARKLEELFGEIAW
jgi:hypothetical protein